MNVFVRFFFIFSLMTLSVFAADKGGNGGDGVMIDGQIHLLDLVEAGIEEEPFINRSIEVDQDIKNLANSLKISGLPTNLFASKLMEIKKVHPAFALAIAQTMKLYNWRLVSSVFVDIQDEETILERKNLIQLAIRKEDGIFISRTRWSQLSEVNKIALIFHEIVYAMILTDSIFYESPQMSFKARKIVGSMFSPEFQNDEGINEFRKYIKEYTSIKYVKVINEELYSMDGYGVQVYFWHQHENEKRSEVIVFGDVTDDGQRSIEMFCVQNSQALKYQYLLLGWGPGDAVGFRVRVSTSSSMVLDRFNNAVLWNDDSAKNKPASFEIGPKLLGTKEECLREIAGNY